MITEVQRNPATAAPWLLLGGIVLAGFTYWTLQDEEEGVPSIEPEEEDGLTLDPVSTNTVVVSEDCKVVEVGGTWVKSTAFPLIQQQVQQLGRGLSLYPQSLRERSLDRVVRDVLAQFTPCASDVLWRDVYMNASPFPFIEPIYTSAAARTAIKDWQEGWGSAWTEWSGEYVQMAQLVNDLRNLTRSTYFTNLGVDLQHQPVDTGQYPAALTQGDRGRLLALGYDINFSSLQDFQNHYNLVKNFQTEDQWNGAGLDLPENNTIDSETRDALVDANGMADTYGAWMGLVETAANA